MDQESKSGPPYTARFIHVSKRPTFIAGLRNAGFSINDGDVQFGQTNTHGKHKRMNQGKDSDADLLLTFQSTIHGKAVVTALDGHILEGRLLIANKAKNQSAMLNGRDPDTSVPTADHIRLCISDAFHERAFRDEVEKRGLESALLKQEERLDIFHPTNLPVSSGRTTRGGKTVVEKVLQKHEKRERRKETRKAKRTAGVGARQGGAQYGVGGAQYKVGGASY